MSTQLSLLLAISERVAAGTVPPGLDAAGITETVLVLMGEEVADPGAGALPRLIGSCMAWIGPDGRKHVEDAYEYLAPKKEGFTRIGYVMGLALGAGNLAGYVMDDEDPRVIRMAVAMVAAVATRIALYDMETP